MPPIEEEGTQSQQPAQQPADQAAPAADAQNDAAAPGDQGAEAKKGPQSSLEAVKAVMDGDRAAAEAAAGGANAQQAGGAQAQPAQQDEAAAHAAAAEGEKDWLSPAEWGKLDQRVRKRITGLVSKNKAVRQEFDTYRSAAEPKARTFDDLHRFTRQLGLTGPQLGGYFELIRQIHQDPARAWQTIQPTLRYLQEHVGEVLPKDLQEAVDGGQITAEYAKQLAGERRERVRLQGDRDTRAQADEQAAVQRRFEAVVNDQTETVRAWEKNWQATDPDYAKKKDRVWERMVTLLDEARRAAGGAILPKDKVLEIAERAKKDVSEWVAGLLPPKREQRPVTGGNMNVQAKREPGSSLDAARLGLELSRAA